MLRELFPKVMKWCISASCLIWGVAFLVMADKNGHPGPIILSIFCFGVVYWMYKTRSEIPWQVALVSLLVFIIGVGGALYVPLAVFPFNAGFFAAWNGWALALGLPAVAWAYWKFK